MVFITEGKAFGWRAGINCVFMVCKTMNELLWR